MAGPRYSSSKGESIGRHPPFCHADAECRGEDPLARGSADGILVKVMPRDKSLRSGWRCDSCGELVTDPQAGWVEWLAAEDVKGKPKVSGLRLVHSRNASPRRQEPCGCQYNPRNEFRKNQGIVEGLALDRFTGTDGLMLLLSMIAGSELPVQELIEIAKRVQIPGYEAAYELFHDAISEGAIAPAIAPGFYLQCEIWDALRWAKYRTPAKTDQVERQNRCVVSH